MDRLTRISENGENVWFVYNDLNLKPYEMNTMHNDIAIRKLAYYEDLEEQELLTNERVFKEEDFTEDQLQLLRMAFKLVDDVIEIQRYDNYDVHLHNELYYLKEKLGIYDILNT